MNREAAEDCVEKAVSYLSEGKIEKAEKLLAKSLTLHPTKRAEGKKESGGWCVIDNKGQFTINNLLSCDLVVELLEKIKCGAYTKRASSGNLSDDGLRQRPTASGSSTAKADSGSEADYTPEQLDAVKRIKK